MYVYVGTAFGGRKLGPSPCMNAKAVGLSGSPISKATPPFVTLEVLRHYRLPGHSLEQLHITRKPELIDEP